MNIFIRDITARRKIIIYFLVGILVPSLIVGYLSWEALSKRREAFRSVIESQLWISGETAIKSIESALQNYEDAVLSRENFPNIPFSDTAFHKIGTLNKVSEKNIFLLDADFQLVYPSAGTASNLFLSWQHSLADSPYWNLFQRAEQFEFTSKDYSKAAYIYKQCLNSTSVKQLQAFAWEGHGRCLTAQNKKAEAHQVYQNLIENYGAMQNKTGHPYGLLAALRVKEISREIENGANFLKEIVNTYIKLREGEWRLRSSVFDFYTEELEAIIKQELSSETFPELWKSYQTSKVKQSPFLLQLAFIKRLGENVIPVIKERIAFSQYENEVEKGRFPITLDEYFYFVSYNRLQDSKSSKYFYTGFSWDLELVKNNILPDIAKTIAATSAIEIRIIEDLIEADGQAPEYTIPKDSLSLSSNQFPFPWRYIITQTAVSKLKNTAWKENVFHAALLFIIVGLMCLGALLIARDISRESAIIKQKSEFVHNISHELKTPLTLIRLYGETLKDKKGLNEENKQKAYQVITRESERLSIMINNVLDFSRLEMGEKEYNLKPGNISKTVKEILDSYRYHFESKKFTLHEQIEGGMPVVNFNREALASVLINLLSNAVKFSPDRKEVSVRLFRQEGSAVLQVADQGIGISKIELENIFKRFYRADNEVVSGSKGSGLGLTIIRHIAEAHNGKIIVKSVPGKGSEFSLYLPFYNPKEVKQ